MIAFTAALAGILFGYDTGVMSGAILFIAQEFGLSSGMNGIVVGAVLFGAFLGAIVTGHLTDYFGRKRLLIGVAIIFIVGSIETSLAPNIPWLIAGRVFIGIAIGIASYTAPLYISEISPVKHRGALVSLNQLAISIGILGSYVVDYYASMHGGWREMLAIGVVPALLLLIGMFFLPESPRWVLSKGFEDEARLILRKIRGPHANTDKEFHDIEEIVEDRLGTWKMLISKRVRPVLWIGFGLAIIQQVTGINTILYYAPTILKMSGFESATAAILATMGVGVIFVLFTIVALPLIDKWGRRPLLLTGLIGMAAALGFMALIFRMSSEAPSLHWLALLSMVIYIACFAFSLGPIMWLMFSEIYPLKIRGLGASLATCMNWASNLLVTATFLKLVDIIGESGTFSIYMMFSFLSLFFVYFCVPETKGISLEQIEKNLLAGKKWRKLGR